jgi:hypothetical protein
MRIKQRAEFGPAANEEMQNGHASLAGHPLALLFPPAKPVALAVRGGPPARPPRLLLCRRGHDWLAA